MAVDLEYYGVPPADYRELENRTRLTATAGQTTFSAPYSVGYVDVYYNGAKLDPFTEFSATDGANIVLATGATASGDIVEVISRGQVQLANVYTQQQVNALLVPYFGVATGTGDAQVVVTSPTFSSYVDGMDIKIRTAGRNITSMPTINCNGLGAKSIVSNNAGASLYGRDWVSGSEITIRYNQTLDKFILLDGNTTALTPAQFTNNNQISTTAFVQSAIGNYSTLISLSTPGAISGTTAGQVQVFQTNGTYTLPDASTLATGSVFKFITANVTNVVLQTTASQRIYLPNSNSASVTLNSGDSIELTVSGNGWYATDGSLLLGIASATASMGYGQTLQSFTGSKTTGTTYYNTTLRPIYVIYAQGGGSQGNISVSINGATAVVVSSVYQNGTATFIVPPGASYLVTTTVSPVSSPYWAEIR